MSKWIFALSFIVNVVCLLGCQTATIAPPIRAQVDYDVDTVVNTDVGETERFFSRTTYHPDIPPPETMLGYSVGARLAHHSEIINCFKKWATASKRVNFKRYAVSPEGRELIRVVVSSEENMRRLDEIKANIAKLADPRTTTPQEAKQIIATSPAVAWMGYSIHGNELSGADAALSVGYHLIAGTSADVTDLLEKLIVVIDPVMNPDGRQRSISHIDQAAGEIPNLDYASLHRGRWPWGRGNHYLFDMNRDWIVGIAPETRGRWNELLEFHPQLVVDAHEMGALDTYLFYPAAPPFNPNRPATLLKWQNRFANNHAVTFDKLGWSYYTREWVDGWYPGYSDAWSSINGAIGMLYEQASLRGQPLRRPSGQVVTYASSVRAQAISSLSNLRTLAKHRQAILADYHAFRAQSVAKRNARTFALRTGRAPNREQQLIETLMRQGIEVHQAQAAFTVPRAHGVLGKLDQKQSFPAGTYLIAEAQPQGPLLATLLQLDPRFPKETLVKERKEIELKGKSKIYDVTAWDLAHAFDVDGYWIPTPRVAKKSVTRLERPQPGIAAPEKGSAYAWVLDGTDDRSVTFAAAAMEHGIKLHVADKAFTTAGRHFVRGSLLIRQAANDPGVEPKIAAAAKQAGVTVIATPSGRSPDDGPDLGGQHFKLLHRPKVAVLTNWPIWPTDYGHVWHQLDTELKLPFTILDIQMLEGYDLRRYNVIIIPSASTSIGALLAPHAKALASWVRGGGTLIAMGSSAAALTAEKFELGTTRLRRDALNDLEGYVEAAQREIASRRIDVDPAVVFGDTAPPPPVTTKPKVSAKNGLPLSFDLKKIKATKIRQDEYKRRFSPKGTMLRGLVHLESWLTYGCREELPLLFAGEFAFVSRPPVITPVRLAPAAMLRLAGLIWPEAVERVAGTAYLTTESIGAGQLILFAVNPTFRAYTKGTSRLLANAIVYGPSLGAKQPLVW